MRDLIQKIDNILKESSEQHTGLFQVGDEFGISFSENLEIATTIVGFVEDGIVVELDDTAISIMEDNGARFFNGYLEEGLRDPKDNPCWKGYKPVGTKKKNGKTVPNCVPKESIEEATPLGYYSLMSRGDKSSVPWWAKAGDIKYMGSSNMSKELTQKIYFPDMFKGREFNRYFKGDVSAVEKEAEELGMDQDENGDWYIPIYKQITQSIKDRVNRAKYLFGDHKRVLVKKDKESFEDINQQIASEAEYQGKDVPLGKKLPGDVKKYKVYVKNPKGNVVKVNFGDKKMRIKKSNPERRKSFRARHNCDNPGPRTSARYWSCRNW